MQATRRLASFLRPYWLWAVLAPLLMVLEVAMDLLQPLADPAHHRRGRAALGSERGAHHRAWMVGVAVIGLIGGLGCTVFAILAGQHFGADLRAALFRKVQSLSFGNLDRLETGALITRLTNDVTQVQEVVMMHAADHGARAAAAGRQPDHGDPHQPAAGAALCGADPAGAGVPGLDHQQDLPAVRRGPASAGYAEHRAAGEPCRGARRQSVRPRRPRDRALRPRQRQPDGAESQGCAH